MVNLGYLLADQLDPPELEGGQAVVPEGRGRWQQRRQ